MLTMRLNFYNLIFPCVLLLSISFSYADTNLLHQKEILCPSLDKVQASVMKLDTAQKINDHYIVYTATPFFQENNIWWFSGAGNIIATSNNEAITLGKEIFNDLHIQIDIYPKKVGNEFICNYAPGYVQARGKNLGSIDRG